MPLQHSTLTADLAVGEKIDGANWDEPHEVVTSLNFPPQASDPASPVDGDVWTTTGGVLKARLAGTVRSFSGNNTGDQTITLTGDVTGSGTGTFAATLATVNGNVGTFGAAGTVPQVTVNGKGLVTAVAAVAIAITASQVSDSGANGRALMQGATASANRTTLGLGALATLNTVDLSTLATGTLQAAQEPAHTGDVTNTAGSLALTIAPAAVTLAKMANLAANSLIGNNTGSAATPAALTASQVKTLLAIAVGDVSGLGSLAALSSVDLSGAQASGVLAAARFPALTGDVTTSAGSLATTIGNNTVGTTKIVPSSVTNAKLANMADQTLKGNISGAAAAPSDLTATQVKTMLAIAAGDVSGLGALATASNVSLTTQATGTLQAAQAPAHTGDVTSSAGSLALSIAANAVTNAKLATMAANTVKANATSGAATPTDIALSASQLFGRGATGDLAPITLGTNLSMSGTTLNASGGGLSDGDKGDIIVSGSGTVLSADTTTVAMLAGTQTFTGNKTFNGTTTFAGYTQFNDWAAADDTDPTKVGAFDMSLISTGTTRTYSFPNATGTLALTSDLAAYQPLDGDLTALAALSGTNTLYYRSAANTWSAVTIGANLTFSGGTLSASGGGGLTDGDYGDVIVSGSGTAMGLDYTAVNAVIAPVFANVTSKPTTVSGYGITDAVTTSGNQTVGGTKTLSDPLVLTGQTSDPSSPADGTAWHDSQIDTVKAVVGTRTRDLLADLVNSGAMAWKASNGATAMTTFGYAVPTATGTATAASIAVTNKHTMSPRLEYLVTVAATTAVAGFRGSNVVTVGGASANLGGFRCAIVWGPATGVSTSTSRAAVGLRPAAAPTDVEPSTLVNGVWMGWDAADTNVQIMHNDGSGTATKIDLGSNFAVPTTDRTSVYKLELFSPKGTTQSVQYRVTDMVNGYVAQGTISTNLPSTTTLIAPVGGMSVGGTSSVIGVALMSMYLDPLL